MGSAPHRVGTGGSSVTISQVEREGGRMTDHGLLTVDFLGTRHDVHPGNELTFGRAADLVVDDENPFLQRVLGRFRWVSGTWWVDNFGSRIGLAVFTQPGVRSELPPRRQDGPAPTVALPPPGFSVQFNAGGFAYELVGDIVGDHPTADLPSAADDAPAYPTVTLTYDERQMLLVLAAPVVRDWSAGPEALPANREIARALGWTLAKYNRKLDYLCLRLGRVGVRGIVGARGVEARNRRWLLARYAVAAGMVTAEPGEDAR
jgi:hypothetical protein